MMVFLVVAAGMILAAYERRGLADAHALTVTGAKVLEVPVRDTLADDVREDLAVEAWDDDDETPVEIPRPRK